MIQKKEAIPTIIILASFFLLRPDYAAMTVFISLIVLFVILKGYDELKNLGVSFIIAFLWMSIAKDMYDYNTKFISIAGMNIFPLLAWTLGLYILVYIFENFKTKISAIKKILLFTIYYILLLLIAETVSYHLLNIRNLATTAYEGLAFCNCLHAPVWMQIAYIAMGPIYYVAIFLVKHYGHRKISS